MLIKQLIETPYHKPENKVKTSGISERLLRCNDFPCFACDNKNFNWGRFLCDSALILHTRVEDKRSLREKRQVQDLPYGYLFEIFSWSCKLSIVICILDFDCQKMTKFKVNVNVNLNVNSKRAVDMVVNELKILDKFKVSDSGKSL